MTAVAGASGFFSAADHPNKIGSYVLVAPDVGTYDVVITYSNSTSYGQVGFASSYSGVDQTTPTEGGNYQTGSTNNYAGIPTTTTVNGDVIVGLLSKNDRPITSVACDDTQIGELINGDANNVFNAGFTTSSGSGNELNWTTDASTAGAWTAFALKASAASTFVAGQPNVVGQAVNRASTY